MSELIQTNLVIGEFGNIAEITLNKPKALNSLNIEMIDALQVVLDQCEKDDTVKCVFIQGEGEKAFCAGGDVVSLYHSMQETAEGDIPELASEFFTKEYKFRLSLTYIP